MIIYFHFGTNKTENESDKQQDRDQLRQNQR